MATRLPAEAARPNRARRCWGKARAFVLGPSFRGGVGPEVVQALATKGARIAVDVQGWVRVVRDGKLALEDWPQARQFLAYVTMLKTEAMEAERLTGQAAVTSLKMEAEGPFQRPIDDVEALIQQRYEPGPS